MKIKLLKPEGTRYDQLQLTFFSAQVNNFGILYIELLTWIVIHLQNQLGDQTSHSYLHVDSQNTLFDRKPSLYPVLE